MTAVEDRPFAGLTNFERGVLLDAYLDADPVYWRRRARQFADVGNARCNEIARACWNRARLEDQARAEFAAALVDLARGAA